MHSKWNKWCDSFDPWDFLSKQWSNDAERELHAAALLAKITLCTADSKIRNQLFSQSSATSNPMLNWTITRYYCLFFPWQEYTQFKKGLKMCFVSPGLSNFYEKPSILSLIADWIPNHQYCLQQWRKLSYCYKSKMQHRFLMWNSSQTSYFCSCRGIDFTLCFGKLKMIEVFRALTKLPHICHKQTQIIPLVTTDRVFKVKLKKLGL